MTLSTFHRAGSCEHVLILYSHLQCSIPRFLGSNSTSLFSYPLDTSPEGLNRNAENIRKLGAILGPLAEVARSHAEKVGLKIDWNDPAASVSKLAVITQTPKEFDFPGIPWPAQFHYGLFYDDEG